MAGCRQCLTIIQGKQNFENKLRGPGQQSGGLINVDTEEVPYTGTRFRGMQSVPLHANYGALANTTEIICQILYRYYKYTSSTQQTDPTNQ